MHVIKENIPLQLQSDLGSSKDFKGRPMTPPPLQLAAQDPSTETTTKNNPNDGITIL